ncbi:hypothetical protein D3C76_1320600 [compost metagenome]
MAIAEKQHQATHQQHAGHATAELAYAPAQAHARLQQGLASRACSGIEALVEHAQLHPGAGMFFVGGVPFVEFGPLGRAAVTAVQAQLPGNGRIEYPCRYRLVAQRTHVGSPYSAM